jgi:hypothetical protein
MMQITDNKYTNSKEQLYVTQDVDAYTDNVDNLMDDLFGDVESTLHVDYAKQRSQKQKSSQTKQNKTSAPYASVTPSSSDIVAIPKLDTSEKDLSTSKDTVSITKLNLADIALPPISKQDVLWIQPYIMRNPEPTSNLPSTPPELAVSKYNLIDRLLLVFACSSALVAAIMWTINHGIWLGRQSVNVPQVSAKDTGSNKAFGEEIKRMLAEVVDKNRAIANANNTIGSNIPLMAAPLIGNMPPLSVGANPFANSMQQPMYVPVYQPPNLSNSGNAPSPLALPPATANNSVDVGNSTITSKPNAAVSTQFTAAPAPSYTLIGVLDLGDRSTAMLDINGSVQSIGLGKAISNTGWVLSRVSQQEIILKRGQETKTIFVGQKF